jgi:hypothetical protein
MVQWWFFLKIVFSKPIKKPLVHYAWAGKKISPTKLPIRSTGYGNLFWLKTHFEKNQFIPKQTI